MYLYPTWSTIDLEKNTILSFPVACLISPSLLLSQIVAGGGPSAVIELG